MSETQAEPHVNGTAPTPAPAAEPCVDCATPGEKLMGILAIAFAAFIVLMGIDMITGGKVTGYAKQAVEDVRQ